MSQSIDPRRREVMLGLLALPLAAALPIPHTLPPMTVAEAIAWLHQVGFRHPITVT